MINMPEPWELNLDDPETPDPAITPEAEQSVSETLDNFGDKFRVGTGDKTIRIEKEQGLWIGDANFGDAPFSVDMSGNIVATGLQTSELHIPDEVTADSFHVETDGDTWWGATTADFNSDNDNANAYVLKDGTAKFQSVTITGSGSNIEASAQINSVDASQVQERAEEQHINDEFYIGRFDDGMNTSFAGSGQFSRGLASSDISCSGSGSFAKIYSDEIAQTLNGALTFGASNTSFEITAKFDNTNTMDAYLGFWISGAGAPSTLTNATSTERHIGFFWDDSTLYASNANGTTQTKTDISSGITFTDRNVYSFRVTGSTSVEFFINGVSKATHTTNLPTSNIIDLYFFLNNTASGSQSLLIKNNYLITNND